MSMPMFSIIVPTLRSAATVGACLESLVRQTYRDFELVVVDGESTDDTLTIVNSFAPEFGTRMVVHSGPDEGIYDAMNHGVAMATGSWLLFLGSDDVLHDADTLARVAGFIDDNQPSDLVYGDVVMNSTGARHAGVFDLDRLLFETNICHQSIFYRRRLFDGIGPYNARYRIWADWDFNIRCFSNPALAIRYMDIVIADYNDLTGTSIREGTDKEFRKRLPMFFWMAGAETCRRMLAFYKQKDNRRLAMRAWVARYKAVPKVRSRNVGS